MCCNEYVECVVGSGVEGGRNIRVAGLVVWFVLPSVSTPPVGSRFHLVLVLCGTCSGLCDNGSRHGLGLQMYAVVKVEVVCPPGCCVVNVFSCAWLYVFF